jgi:hypothetical protein
MNRGPFINPFFYTPLDGLSNSSSLLDEDVGVLLANPPTTPSTIYTPQVVVKYNASGLHTICGTSPMMTLSHTFNRTDVGQLMSITNKITLNGRIYNRDASASGIDYVLAQEQKLKDLFKNCPIGTFSVDCGGASVISFTGVKALSVSTESSPDYLTKSIPYTIDLEYIESANSADPFVVSCSDSWNVEPISDEYLYANFNEAINAKPEYNNPFYPAGQPSTRTPLNPSTLQFTQIPQFKVSRKLTAKGVLHESVCGTGSGYYNGYLDAKKWVENRLSSPWQSTNASGAYFGGPFSHSTMSGSVYLYNHVRSMSFSITEGTYELNDTWLAMPTGITHTEDYTIDVSTDEKYIKTVKVQGTIKGLTIANANLVTGTGNLSIGTDGKVGLSGTLLSGQTGGTMTYSTDTSVSTSIASRNNKYDNALVAWHSGIKPFLYQRASAGLNRPRYTQSYVPNGYDRDTVLQNPTYSQDNRLNIIPWSTTESHDPRKGVITYGYEYNNKFTILSGVISENISIDDSGPTDVYAEVFVIGRTLGPVLQTLSAKTSSKKNVSIDITVMPVTGIPQYFMTNASCPLYTGGNIYNTIEKIIDGLKPFGTRDPSIFVGATRNTPQGQVYLTENTQNWNPAEGRYSRKVGWVYQQCTNARSYLDT